MRKMLLVMALAGCGLGLLPGFTGVGRAQETGAKPVPVLSTAGGMRDALLQLAAGQPIEVTLANGKAFAGQLGTVGAHTMILTKLSGKDYYDALIRIDDVSSIEVRVRGH